MSGVDALGNVELLGTDADVHTAGRAVEGGIRGVIADVEDACAHGVGDVVANTSLAVVHAAPTTCPLPVVQPASQPRHVRRGLDERRVEEPSCR